MDWDANKMTLRHLGIQSLQQVQAEIKRILMNKVIEILKIDN